MMKTTEWVLGEKHGRRTYGRVTYGIDYDFARRNKQAPYFSITFSITGEIDEGEGRGGSVGCVHDAIKAWFPRLAPLLKWHLVAVGQGPLHYAANAVYWWEHAEAIRTFGQPYEWKEYGSPRAAALHHFRSTAIVGALPDDVEPREGTHPAQVREWLLARLPALLEAFMSDMRAAGVLE